MRRPKSFNPETSEEIADAKVRDLDGAIARARTMLDEFVPAPELAAAPRR